MFTILSRYVLPGWKGSVAFSLKPTAEVGPVGEVPGLGPRYEPFCAKYMRPESMNKLLDVIDTHVH